MNTLKLLLTVGLAKHLTPNNIHQTTYTKYVNGHVHSFLLCLPNTICRAVVNGSKSISLYNGLASIYYTFICDTICTFEGQIYRFLGGIFFSLCLRRFSVTGRYCQGPLLPGAVSGMAIIIF